MNKILAQYAGDRNLTEKVEKELDERMWIHDGTIIWRGLPYLTENIKPGEIVKEWYGASHWSLRKNHSIKFTTDYISEGLLEEITEERGILWEEAEELFSPLLMQMEDVHIPVVELYRYVDEDFIGELEILIRGYDFKIKNVNKAGNMYIANVEPIKRAA